MAADTLINPNRINLSKNWSGQMHNVTNGTADQDVVTYSQTQFATFPVLDSLATGDKIPIYDVSKSSYNYTTVDEKVYAYYKNQTTNNIAADANQVMSYNIEVADTHDAVTTGNAWIFTAPYAGYYDVRASVGFNWGTAWTKDAPLRLILFKNNVEMLYLDAQTIWTTTTPVSTSMMLKGSAQIYLAEDDTIQIQVYQNNGGAVGLLNDGWGGEESYIIIASA
jgi:hypothetical protein